MSKELELHYVRYQILVLSVLGILLVSLIATSQ